ncbi:TIGR03862 family flavoprotein [Pseudomaricurvus sp. HS19]|uniref:NAD(P)/FAD-dependent oxidoreductase n=1 Tax=Pseudomaricurvus sp. HS19 TaxID=2692626 RepID=UPI00136E1AD4|nr:TIGR03862 family flavoprotein [Pseudomaricurvus sp. HS19]MYM61967.1 TIGR03862 family flavoprotein [Pseudomaricurvus sp. HS19]
MTTPPAPQTLPVAVIGAGPAGLMAAEQLAGAGYKVAVFESMPSAARKFLRAGVGGMNITHAEGYEQFLPRYREAEPCLRPAIDAFTPDELRGWIHALGVETFVGTSGRVFPREMKAAPLLRAWLHRLREQGITLHTRHRWVGLQQDEQGLCWQLDTPHGVQELRFGGVVLALGGGSWPQLGSTGNWCDLLGDVGVEINPLQASNCGFELPWSDYIRERFAGTPLKNVGLGLTTADGQQERQTGECIVSAYGVEGSLVYALSAPLRELTQQTPDKARLLLDWLPHNSEAEIVDKLQQARKGMSSSNLLQKKLKLPSIANALLRECCPDLVMSDHRALARALKAMPLPTVTGTRPLSEAISSAGGVRFTAVDEQLMLRALPGVFVAGEMLDWEAPTGGYLLTACFATGRLAGRGLANWLALRGE